MPNQLAKSMHEIAKQNRLAQRGPTNADRIRGMSDEELAKFINGCEAAGYHDESITPTMNDGYHMDVLDWLQRPAEEERDGQTI